nr:MAG TPA: hypothetical protein [Caudoviricetes sp.]
MLPLLSFTVSFFPHSIPHCPHSVVLANQDRG